MTNMRDAGNTKAHVNQAYAGDADKKTNPDPKPYCVGYSCFATDVGREFPILIDNRTWLVLKIDAITSNAQNPGPLCDLTGAPVGAYQRVLFGFRLGDGSSRWVEFTAAGHESKQAWWVTTPLGEMRTYYLYNLLKETGGVVEPVFLEKISISQRMSDLCVPSTVQHDQHMEVDHIGIFDGVIYDGPYFEFIQAP